MPFAPYSARQSPVRHLPHLDGTTCTPEVRQARRLRPKHWQFILKTKRFRALTTTLMRPLASCQSIENGGKSYFRRVESRADSKAARRRLSSIGFCRSGLYISTRSPSLNTNSSSTRSPNTPNGALSKSLMDGGVSSPAAIANCTACRAVQSDATSSLSTCWCVGNARTTLIFSVCLQVDQLV